MLAEFVAIPDYAFFTLRDVENYAMTEADRALETARRQVAASTGYAVYVVCAQESLAVRMVVSESPPEDAASWTAVTGLPLECPTGELQMGDVTGKAVLATASTGAGFYTVDVHHQGRDEARNRLLELQRARQGTPITLDELAPLAAIEQYHLVIRPAPA